MNPDIYQIPGTDLWALKNDCRKLTAETGIFLDHEMAALPEVQRLGQNDTVLDIGAFIADTTLFLTDKGCTVHAFEPFPDAYECLAHNAPKAKCYHMPVGDGRNLRNHPTPVNGDFGTRALRLDDEHGKPSLRIDDLRLHACTFAKIDVEGCEVFVLDGMRETIEKFKPVILIEAYDSMLARFGFTRLSILNRLFEHGYSVRVAIGRAEDDRLDFLAWIP